MAIIDIKRINDRAVFVPDHAQVDEGDTVIWRNLDEKESHWIRPVGAPRDKWFGVPLAPYTGDPADTTDELLAPLTSVTYECALHGGEQGKIN